MHLYPPLDVLLVPVHRTIKAHFGLRFGSHLHIPTSNPANSPYNFGPTTATTQTYSIPQYSRPQLASPVNANANTFFYQPPPPAAPPMQRTPSIVLPRKRARHTSPSPTPSSSSHASSPTPSSYDPTTTSPVIGHVLANKRFKCSEASCATLTFNRQADLRRHYENRHARREGKEEFYCPVKGCGRSRDVGAGRRGRSFQGRKDKRDEHLRTVHKDRDILGGGC